MIGAALEAATDALRAAGVETPRLDAEVLLEQATGFERARFAIEPELPMPAGAGREFAAFVRRRLAREPVAYITGQKGFRRILLECDPRALIPRPETELLVEVALEREGVPGAGAASRIADIGTGTGAVALALADEIEGCEVVATDTSPAALSLARHNAHRLGLGDRVELLEASVPEGRFDVVLANLPYVSVGEWDDLAPEIREWEPREALLAGRDGLDAIRSVAAEIGPSGSGARCESPLAAFEVGHDQAGAVGEILTRSGFHHVEARPDLAGIDRVVLGMASA